MPNTPSASPTIDRVLRGELCTGCGLCAALGGDSIEMLSTPPGYNRPRVKGPISAETEAAIAATCPGSKVESWSGIADRVDPYWGPWRDVLVGAATDDVTRFEGSSGGAISGLLVHAMKTGLVDRVVHISADPHAPTRNSTAVSRTPEEVIRRAGSRYTASSPLAQIGEALDEGGAIAFVGKPCDVSALRRLARVDPRVNRHVKLMLSFFCAGVPSHDGVRRILAEMDVESEAVTAFRYRGQGWPGNCAAETADGRKVEMSYARSWGDHLSKEVQFRCKICPDAIGGAADVACADAWYGDEAGYPAFDEADGRSLIIARSAVGQDLVREAMAAGSISGEPLPLAEIEKMQPGQARRKRLVLARTASLLIALQPRPDMRGLEVAKAARAAPLRESLHNLLGTLRRTLQGRRSRL
jgi:coenzyme F420 hydrogenase subunit beta